jgi:hypothetical protein
VTSLLLVDYITRKEYRWSTSGNPCWDSVIHELGHVTSGGRTYLREGSSASVCEEPRELLQVRNLRFIHLTSFNSLVENCSIETVCFVTIILEFNVNQAILNNPALL